MLKLEQINRMIKEVFTDKLVKTVDTVYQKSSDGKFYMLVISIHGLELDDTIIIHTKLIFPSNLDKTEVIDNTFSYLSNLGCGYRYIEYTKNDINDLKSKIVNILDSNDFDEDLRYLSEFLSDSPNSKIDEYLFSRGVDKISVHEVKYNPKFKISPCKDTTYDFDLNINNNYKVGISIKRVDSKFEVSFKMNDITSIIIDSLGNIAGTIGEQLIIMFDKILYNKKGG